MKTKKIRNVIIKQLGTPDEISKAVSKIILKKIELKRSSSFIFATGSSPVGTYKMLIEDHKNNNTDWNEVTTFNLDEYIGIEESHPQSYRTFMNKELFDHLNIKKENTFLPSGMGDPKHNASEYEKLIKNKGPFNLCLLGVGTNGHIAFNEPGSDFKGITKETPLTEETIKVNNEKYFNDIGAVPKTAITMGIGTILNNSNKIVMIAFGESKQKAINAILKGEQDIEWPITALLNHDDVEIYTDCLI